MGLEPTTYGLPARSGLTDAELRAACDDAFEAQQHAFGVLAHTVIHCWPPSNHVDRQVIARSREEAMAAAQLYNAAYWAWRRHPDIVERLGPLS